MPLSRRRLSRWFGIGLLTLLLLIGVVVARRQPPTFAPQTGQIGVNQVAELPKIDSPLPTVIIEGTIFPTETPPPTLTPWPTATRRPGPTATAIPLPQPEDSAKGLLLYSLRTKTDGYSTSGKILQLGLDEKGYVSSPAQEIGLGWMRTYASWDRNFVAFVERTMDGERIHILNPITGKTIPLIESMHRFGFFLDWHPNSRELLYLVGDSVYGGLWLVDSEKGLKTIVVQQSPLYIIDGAISPDGQRIIYTQQEDVATPGELWTVFADGSEPRLLISGVTATALTWSPDNRKIAYFGNQGLCIASLDNPSCKFVVKNANPGSLVKPVWSPDGQYLVYVATEADSRIQNKSPENEQNQVQDWDKEAFIGSNVHLLNAETGEERALVVITPSNKISGYIDPTWSPDGKLIAFAGLDEERAGIWIINIDGTDLHQIAESSTVIRFPVWVN